jgi:hypothetical protein
MMPTFLRLAAIVVAAGAVSCSDPMPTSPTPPVPSHATITIDSVTTASERVSNAGGQYLYRVVLRLRETSGVAATIPGVDLTFMSGATVLMMSHHDQPVPSSANVCPASGSVETRELVASDAASHPYATTVHAKVTYRDTTGAEATANGSGEVPPLDQPAPLPPTRTLAGTITDQATSRAIVGARVEVLNGVNAGTAGVADGAGVYTLSGLLADTFRLRASAAGYEPGEQNVTVPDIPKADFQLRKSGGAESCVYSVSPSGVLNVPFTGGQFTLSITRVSGTCGWSAASAVDWITPASDAGTGTARVTFSYRPNAAFVGRSGSVSVDWDGGRVQLTVAQAAETPAFCRIVTLTVDGRSVIDVAAGGGQFTALIAPEAGTPPGACGNWTASASAGITFVGATSGPALPASLVFVVQSNAVSSPRSMSVSVDVSGRTAGLTVNQAGTRQRMGRSFMAAASNQTIGFRVSVAMKIRRSNRWTRTGRSFDGSGGQGGPTRFAGLSR